jgi:DNA-binding beta-propeller fold protein YncE
MTAKTCPVTIASALLLSAVVTASPAAPAETPAAENRPAGTHLVKLPGGEAGIGFDDLQYAAGLKKVLVPGGRTGRLFLITPGTREVSVVEGFSSKADYKGGHGDGTTSACEEEGLVYASDRGSHSVKIVDPASGIIGSVALGGGPDYVRCSTATKEVWVTEPGKEQIEILALAPGGRSAILAAKVAVPGGPESLVFDPGRMRAYTHTWKETTYALDLKRRTIAEKWHNGCGGSRGIALDAQRRLLFVGCEEGKAVVLDTTTGKILSSSNAGSDVDSIGYGAPLGHLFVPGGGSADLSILGVSSAGKLALLRTFPTGPDAHTAAFDPDGHAIYIGLPEHGEVLIVDDPNPAPPR